MSQEIEMVLMENSLGDSIVLTVKGNINSGNAREFGERMVGLIESGCLHLVVDMGDLKFMTSAGFRALLVAGKNAEKMNGSFVLCGVNESIHRLFELGGFLDLFPIYTDQKGALSRS